MQMSLSSSTFVDADNPHQSLQSQSELTDTESRSETDEAESDLGACTILQSDDVCTDSREESVCTETQKTTGSHWSSHMQPKAEGDLRIYSQLECGCEVMVCQFNNDGSLLAVGLSNGTIKVYNTDTSGLVQTLRDSESLLSSLPVTALRFTLSSKSHSLLLATYASGSVRCWYIWGHECLWTVREVVESSSQGEPKQEPRQTLSLSISSSGEKAAAGGSDSAIHLYDMETQQRLSTCSASFSRTLMDGHRLRVFAVTFHPEKENEFISGGWDNTIHFWDTRQQHSVRMLSGPHICGDSLHIDPVTNQILSGSWRKEKALEIWEYSSGQKICEVPEDPHGQSRVYTCDWLGQDYIVAGGSQPNMLRLIDRRTLMSVSRVLGLPSAIFSSSNSPRGKCAGLIAVTSESRVFLLDSSSHLARKQNFHCEEK
ncbi:uncharacterized protein LOC125741790 isoform X2 [Brienomyrus brachyistius]|uniref:uncharacterized protein LOC125741790 isoform X2 n=1 Tax=Brienomyrus brachyistius TaxID=42636 RepID=UPI0020B18E61|nr:uncharacterized protein LOC125741790 isoform X2 [Brienomyrus brachyistius]